MAMTSITVGAALSLTGIYALQGGQALQGLRLWVEETNARGGVLIPESGRHASLQLIVYDDHSRGADVAQLVEQLITIDRVDGLFGPYSSGLTRVAARVAEAHRKVLWNHGGSSDVLMGEGWRWTVHLPTPASRYFAGLFPCLQSYEAAVGGVAIVQRRRGTFSSEVADGVRQRANQGGFPVLPIFFYPDERWQIPGLAKELAAANPALIIAVGRYDDDVALVRSLADTSLEVQIMATVATPMQAFWNDLQALADGCIGPSQWEPGVGASPDIGPAPAAFVERFRQRFGTVPDYPAAQAYAAGLILQHCVSVAGTCLDADWRATAEKLACRTFYGDFRLETDTGIQVGHETVLVQWQGGEKKIIWPPREAQAKLISPKP
jgi:branched-chain amino acid transport system substrate-binding protein